MNNRFFELPKEKQDRFINAALQIFAKNGYKKASTDEIVKAAAFPRDCYSIISEVSRGYTNLSICTA